MRAERWERVLGHVPRGASVLVAGADRVRVHARGGLSLLRQERRGAMRGPMPRGAIVHVEGSDRVRMPPVAVTPSRASSSDAAQRPRSPWTKLPSFMA